MPSDDPSAGFVLEYNVDQVEIEVFKNWFPKFVQFEKEQFDGKSELELIVPKFFAGDFSLDHENRGFYLVLEDLHPEFAIIKDNKGPTTPN